jgi:hypothetical protein
MALVLHESAGKMQIALPEPVDARLSSLRFAEENALKPTAKFEEGSAVADMVVDLVIGCQPVQVGVRTQDMLFSD